MPLNERLYIFAGEDFSLSRGDNLQGSFFPTKCRPQKNGTWNADIDGDNVLVRRTLAQLPVWELEHGWICPSPGRLFCDVGGLRGAVPTASGEAEFAAGHTSGTGFSANES
jgi:hypothetical protein